MKFEIHHEAASTGRQPLRRTGLKTALLSPLLAAMLLVGCNKADGDKQATNPPTDGSMAKAEQGADEMKADASKGMDQAKDAAKGAVDDVKQGTKDAIDATKNAVSDAAITTSVKASLAKDKDLSALSINVDTQGGKVVLNGSAPDAGAKDRATQIASSVKGVDSVDNQLTVKQ